MTYLRQRPSGKAGWKPPTPPEVRPIKPCGGSTIAVAVGFKPALAVEYGSRHRSRRVPPQSNQQRFHDYGTVFVHSSTELPCNAVPGEEHGKKQSAASFDGIACFKDFLLFFVAGFQRSFNLSGQVTAESLSFRLGPKTLQIVEFPERSMEDVHNNVSKIQ